MNKPLFFFMMGSVMTIAAMEASKSKKVQKMCRKISNMKMPL